MIRTGEEYRESLRDGREIYMNGEKIADVTTHVQADRRHTRAHLRPRA
jgi:aromatic ring hydroxylase